MISIRKLYNAKKYETGEPHAVRGLPLIIYAKFRSNTTNLNKYHKKKEKIWLKKYFPPLANTYTPQTKNFFLRDSFLKATTVFFFIFSQNGERKKVYNGIPVFTENTLLINLILFVPEEFLIYKCRRAYKQEHQQI